MLAASSPVLAIVFIIQYFKYKARLNAVQASFETSATLESLTDLELELNELRQRVQVLEAIVTDGKFELLHDLERIEGGP